MVSWNWSEAQAERGVVHADVANTDHDNAATLVKGYSVEDPYLSADITHFLPLQEDSGSTVFDVSGNNRDGSVTGSTLNATAPLGVSGIQTNGSGDYVDTGFNHSGSDFTLSILLKSNADNTVDTYLGWRDFDGDDAEFRLQNFQGPLKLSLNDGTNTLSPTETSSSYNDDTWYVVTVVLRSTTTAEIWVDGVKESDGTNSSFTGVPSRSENTWLGGYNRSGTQEDQPTQATYAVMQYFDRSLSATEIGNHADILKAATEWASTAKTL